MIEAIAIRMVGVLAAAALASACAPTAPPLASPAEIEAAEHGPLMEMGVAGHWNEPMAPFTVMGNVHYVGTKGVAAWLITSPKGHILIDGILAQSPPQIIANIKTLGFDIGDVKYLLNSHAHIDHAGGLAALKAASGATMLASAADKPILEAGEIDYGPTGGVRFPAVRVDRVIGEASVVRVGNAVLVAHLTPGHTPGCTSWSTTVKDAAGQERSVLFHCSTTVAGQPLVPESYPGMVSDYKASFAKLANYRADILLANHGNFFDLEAKRARQIAGDANAFVDPAALAKLNGEHRQSFEEELAKQRAQAAR